MHAIDLAHDLGELGDLLSERVAHRLESSVRVEVFEVGCRIREAHALVLRGDVTEIGSEVRELRGRRQLSVEEGAAPPFGLHDAANDELAVTRDASGFELGGDPRPRLDLEEGGDLSLTRAAADDLGARATTEHERERVDHHRFACAGLAGEDVEARSELEDLVLDEDDVVDRQREEHGCERIAQRARAFQRALAGCARSSFRHARTKNVTRRAAWAPRGRLGSRTPAIALSRVVTDGVEPRNLSSRRHVATSPRSKPIAIVEQHAS